MRFTLRQYALAACLATLLGGPAYAADSLERTVTIDGVTRTYLIHVPADLPRPAPLVLVFHGGGGRPQAIERKTGMDALADKARFVVVYPAGMARASARGGTWNVGGGFSPGTAADVGFVRAILRDVEGRVPIDPARVYAAGHSMGGIFAYRLACEMSDTFAAIAAVSATMVEPACRPQSPVAILHIHGTADERIPLEGGHGDMTAAGRNWPAPQLGISTWTRLDGCTGPSATHDAGGEACTSAQGCRAPVDFCVITGGTHPWPDGAAARVWAFFAAHPKAGR